MSNSTSPPPLAPPVIGYATPTRASADGVWQENHLLVAAKDATLPPRCVKCNGPADHTLRKMFYWHHPALYLVILFQILIYAIIALIIREKGRVTFSLCDRHHAKRRNAIIAAWLLVPGGLAVIITGGIYESGAVALTGLALFVGGIVALLLVPVLRPTKIDKQFLWFKGVSPAYLAELPGVVRQ